MKKIAILQSNYIPWLGYFDLINSVDTFVIYDDVQYTKRDWRNRNIINSHNGSRWITIPVEVSGKYYQKIRDTKVANRNWNKSHLEIIKQSYKGSFFFKEYWDWVENLYHNCRLQYLTEINFFFISEINKFLNIDTEIRFSSEFNLAEEKSLRLINICKSLDGSDYFSGPSAKSYLDTELFKKNCINLHFVDYQRFRIFTECQGEIHYGMSILDTIFNFGKEKIKDQLKLSNDD